MAKKKQKSGASMKSASNAAERKARAWESASGFVGGSFKNAQVIAVQMIDEMLQVMAVILPGLVVVGIQAIVNEHLSSERCLKHLKYNLRVTGTLASCAAVALDQLRQGEHERYFNAAGIGELFRESLKVIQDAIALSMIRDGPEIFQRVMDMDIDLNTRSRLKHSYYIMKRYLRDVGQHLLLIGKERELDGEQEPAVGRPGSSTDTMPGAGPPGLELPHA
jgi:hypothetical protein